MAELEHIKKCMENMAANTEMYQRVADINEGVDYVIYRMAVAKERAWQAAADMLKEAIKREEGDG